jgi:hypothetical protein
MVESLDAGYRGLSLDLCNCNGELTFCHGGDKTGCGIGRQDPIDTFSQINDWLVLNPDNILVIYLEINVDAGGDISLTDVSNLLDEVPNGFSNRLYQKDQTAADASWPTLQELIQLETQVLFFYIRGPNGNGDHPPGILYFWDSAMMTDYAYESVQDLEERTLESCSILRGGDRRQDCLLMNNFVTRLQFGLQIAPSKDAAEEVNTVEFAQPLMDACEVIHGQKVNVIMVDFWKSGDLPNLIALHNSALVPTSTAVRTTKPSKTRSTPPSPAPSVVPSSFPGSLPTLPQEPSWMPSAIPSDAPSLLPTILPKRPAEPLAVSDSY